MSKLLITGAWNYTEQQHKGLEKQGYDICFVKNEQDVLPEEAYQAEVIICNGLFLYHDIEKFTSLKAIQLTSAGYDRVPVDYINKQGIYLYNARDVYSKPMAEFAIGGVLQLYKQSMFFQKSQENHQWIKHRELLELVDKNVCIIGCGSVGTECAKRFQAFECNVIGVDVHPVENMYYNKIVDLHKLDDVLCEADVIVIAAPLTKETHHLINRKRFEKLKDTAILVNISRGAIVDTEALIERLPKIGGAVIDVFEEEPLQEDNPLWDFENVIVTPHNSFVGEHNAERLGKVVLNNISQFGEKSNEQS